MHTHNFQRLSSRDAKSTHYYVVRCTLYTISKTFQGNNTYRCVAQSPPPWILVAAPLSIRMKPKFSQHAAMENSPRGSSRIISQFVLHKAPLLFSLLFYLLPRNRVLVDQVLMCIHLPQHASERRVEIEEKFIPFPPNKIGSLLHQQLRN